MCGVFGFIAADEEGPDLTVLAEIAVATEARGRHAFGLAWMDGAGRLRSYKAHGAISEHLDVLDMVSDARMLIGHCRWATHGDARDNTNNHPHPCDGGWIMHNGIVRNYEALVERYAYRPTSECDSEVLAMMVADSDRRGTLTRCIEATAKAEGNLVLLGLWKPGELVIVKRGNPLTLATWKGNRYFASLPDALPGSTGAMKDRTAKKFTRADGKIRAITLALDTETPRPTERPKAKPAASDADPKANADNDDGSPFGKLFTEGGGYALSDQEYRERFLRRSAGAN